MIWFLLLLCPLIRLDLIVKCPALTWTEAEWTVTVRRGNDYTHAGLEAQREWLGQMAILFLPFLLLAVLGATNA